MSKDVFLRNTPHNWSRGGAPALSVTPEASAQTQAQKLAAIKQAADAGDPKAKKKLAKLGKRVNAFQKKARKGDKNAIRTLALLSPQLAAAGLVAKTAQSAMRGDDTRQTEILGRAEIMGQAEIMGGEEIVTHGRFIGEEEAALAAESPTEQAALNRRFAKR